jgi:hypothetical protein
MSLSLWQLIFNKPLLRDSEDNASKLFRRNPFSITPPNEKPMKD